MTHRTAMGAWLAGIAAAVLLTASLMGRRMAEPPRGTSTPHANRLIHERSPYLLQHAHNPVDWYPWGDDAFAKARAEQKPIFLSIGYSTCHWCHVMERESFEDARVADVLNRSFVSIKVDREEHPDVDHLYLTAVSALTGQGGWPLTVFLTPQLQPFFGGTYFPPERRGQLPGLLEVLPAVADAWERQREQVLGSAQQLTEAVRQMTAQQATPGEPSEATLHAAFNAAAGSFDPAHGGFGDAPKFPRSHELSFLLHYWARTHTGQALDIVTSTLDHLVRGGIHDQIGGGFHRYSTDAAWLVPHFEKMLYDQALLARTLLEAHQITGRADFADAARGIFDYVLRDLTDASGGFHSAEDADSEGVEGKFYLWTPAQLQEALGPEDAELAARFYGVTPEGHVEHKASILHIEQPLEDFAKLKALDPGTLRTRLAAIRARLLAARSTRVRPHRDDKILTSWNGLMIGAFAYGAAVLDEPRYLTAATRAADFVRATLVRDGLPLRRYRDGEARYAGTLEDYAFLASGLLDLYEAGFRSQDLAAARGLTEQMIAQCWDDAAGGFFACGDEEASQVVRTKDAADGATPSGNSMAALTLLRLGRLTADRRWDDYGRKALGAFGGAVDRRPLAFAQMLIGWDFALGPTRELVIAGGPSLPDTQALVRASRRRFLPRTARLLHPPGPEGEAIQALAPFVRAQGPVQGRPAAYLCENFQCRLPVTDVAALTRLLGAPEAGSSAP